MRSPTDRQLEVLDALIAYTAKHGLPPSLRELGELVGITSTNGILDHLRALERRGLVRQHAKGSARGWVAIQPHAQEGNVP